MTRGRSQTCVCKRERISFFCTELSISISLSLALGEKHSIFQGKKKCLKYNCDFFLFKNLFYIIFLKTTLA